MAERDVFISKWCFPNRKEQRYIRCWEKGFRALTKGRKRGEWNPSPQTMNPVSFDQHTFWVGWSDGNWDDKKKRDRKIEVCQWGVKAKIFPRADTTNRKSYWPPTQKGAHYTTVRRTYSCPNLYPSVIVPFHWDLSSLPYISTSTTKENILNDARRQKASSFY